MKMVEKRRRSPLIHFSIKALLDSYPDSLKYEEPSSSSIDRSPTFLRLQVGILRFSNDETLGAELGETSFLAAAGIFRITALAATLEASPGVLPDEDLSLRNLCCREIVKEYSERMGVNACIKLFERFMSYEGLFFFLGSYLSSRSRYILQVY